MEPKQFLNHNISQIIGIRETKGNKFGLELELEGRGVALPDVATRGWTRHHDGSLRGESVEYATSGAKDYEETKKLVSDLFKKFTANKVKFNDSVRTSTHVHLNFSDKSVKQMINFFCLFTMLEEVLQYYSGEDRKGNLFCISSREAEGVIGILVNSVAKGGLGAFAGDRYKYAACNLSSLYKFGTVEIRTMKGATSAEQVNAWVDILNDMYEYACDKMKSPADLVNNLSFLGAEGLMRDIFKPANLRELMSKFPVVRTLHYSLLEGARLIQVFAYTYDEDFKAEVKIKPADPLAQLPMQIQEGRFRGHTYSVYKPGGRAWNCTKYDDNGNYQPFWNDGDRVSDDPFLVWDAGLQRFVYTRGGERIPCRWRRHHVIADEGPREIVMVEEEPEEDFDDEEDDF